MKNRFLVDAVGAMIGPLLKAVSPTIRSTIVEMVVKLQKKAQATPNRFDDWFVELLADLLGIDDEE